MQQRGEDADDPKDPLSPRDRKMIASGKAEAENTMFGKQAALLLFVGFVCGAIALYALKWAHPARPSSGLSEAHPR